MATLTAIRGDTWEYTATIKDADGDDYNLTGCTIWWTLKRDRADLDANAVLALHWVDGGTAAGIIVASPATGVAVVTLTPAQTDVLTNVGYVYDLQLMDAVGKVFTVDSGSFGAQLDVTRRTTTT